MNKQSAVVPRIEKTLPFRRELKSARRKCQRTQSDLADAVGVSQTAISNWLRGRQVPPPDKVFAIEAALGVVPGGLSIHLGYLPVEGPFGRVFRHLLASEEGQEILRAVGPTM